MTLTPQVHDSDFTLYVGDALDVLKQLPDKHVHCIVTSPPYWGLRDYGVEGQLGLEATPQEYVAKMVGIFAEARRVLRDDGTLWLNLGDSYASNWGSGRKASWISGNSGEDEGRGWGVATALPPNQFNYVRSDGLKVKDLIGIPWRVAFALQANGWVLRSDVVWSKPNCMPESVTDRPTKAHEMVFLFSKAKWVGADPGQFSHISDEDARWLALLFDTEGNIVVRKANNRDNKGHTQFSAQVAFANCSRPLLEQARSIVGAGSIHERTGKNAPIFYWQLTSRQARDLLYRIIPYLIVKQSQARVVIHMQNMIAEAKKRPGGYRTPEYESFLNKCWLTVKSLNRFGSPDLSWVPGVRYGRWVSQPYFYDSDAIREPYHYDGRKITTVQGKEGSIQHRNGERWPGIGRSHHAARAATSDHGHDESEPMEVGIGRNKRSVWEISTKSYPDAHFAVFPEELIEPMIKAGCPEGGTILDPFIGSGTSCVVSRRLGRKTVGIELKPEYAELCVKRTRQLSLLG